MHAGYPMLIHPVYPAPGVVIVMRKVLGREPRHGESFVRVVIEGDPKAEIGAAQAAVLRPLAG
jgi:hypothetical protein